MSKKQKIIWMVNSLGYSGDLMYWRPILVKFAEQFPDTTVYASEPVEDKDISDLQIGNSIPRVLIGKGRFKTSLPSPIAVLKILKNNPQVIVASEFGPLSLLSSIYCRYSKHSRLLLLIEGDPSFLRFNGINRTTIITKTLRSYIARGAHKILCNSKSAADYATNHLNIKADKLITGCYLTSTFERTPSDIYPEEPGDRTINVLFVGQVSLAKGVHHLLNSISMIRSEFESRAVLTIVGTGPDYELIKRQSSDLGLQHIVKFIGRVPYQNLRSIYHNADLLINSSLGDYRALVGFEALSSGLAIIGSIYDGASSEVIVDGKNGYVIDPKDEAGMSAKILSLLDDRQLLQKFKTYSIFRSRMYCIDVATENLKNATIACTK